MGITHQVINEVLQFSRSIKVMHFDRCNLDLYENYAADQGAEVERLGNTTCDEGLDVLHLEKVFHGSVEEIYLVLEEGAQR